MVVGALALSATGASAQAPTAVPLPARPTAAEPSVPAATDTTLTAADSIARDTVRAPLAVSHRPLTPERRGARYVWDRQAIFANGAVTLTDLLADVPGVTVANAGFIMAPTATSWYGDVGRVRVYLDGVELDDLDARTGGVADLATIPLWYLEEVAVERGAGELRVHLRSWRVRFTVPTTRTDILTGSENTNLYRGFYGKRLRNGGAIQFGAQQSSTTSVRTGGDGDALSPFGRIGWARGRLSVDAMAAKFGRIRSPMSRDVLAGAPVQNAIPRFEGDDGYAHLRAAWGSPDTVGLWMQAIASAQRHRETGDTTPGADTAVSQSQFVLSAGGNRWGIDLAGTARLRVRASESRLATAVRASWTGRWASVSAFAETAGPDSTDRLDVVGSVSPIRWVQLQLGYGVRRPSGDSTPRPTVSAARASLTAFAYGRWLSAGLVHRTAATTPALVIFDPRFGPADLTAATGLEVSAGGTLWGPFSFGWRGLRWQEPGPYRPQVESRAELRVASDFRRQIKRGTFGLSAAAIHEYRGGMSVPLAAGGTRETLGASFIGTVLDMRLGSAHIFWHNRNAVGKVYETVPGFLMPRLVQLYGVRWDFWN
ncbi:MAG: hypothetical protein RL340_1008 [Gemmatimonadota bacterium]